MTTQATLDGHRDYSAALNDYYRFYLPARPHFRSALSVHVGYAP
jgi:hypothetical protein